MAVVRLSVPLNDFEATALGLLASRQSRDPRSQAALIIRTELVRAGLLMPDETTTAALRLAANATAITPGTTNDSRG